MAACTFGNSNSIPIALLSAVASTPQLLRPAEPVQRKSAPVVFEIASVEGDEESAEPEARAESGERKRRRRGGRRRKKKNGDAAPNGKDVSAQKDSGDGPAALGDGG